MTHNPKHKPPTPPHEPESRTVEHQNHSPKPIPPSTEVELKPVPQPAAAPASDSGEDVAKGDTKKRRLDLPTLAALAAIIAVPIGIIAIPPVSDFVFHTVWTREFWHRSLYGTDDANAIRVDFVKDHPRIRTAIYGGSCPCVVAFPGAEKNALTVHVRNDCQGTVPLMGVKFTQNNLGLVPGDTLLTPRNGVLFGYVELKPSATAIFDGAGAQAPMDLQVYGCPGNILSRIPLRCQVPPIQLYGPGACTVPDGMLGDKCTCPDGTTGIATMLPPPPGAPQQLPQQAPNNR